MVMHNEIIETPSKTWQCKEKHPEFKNKRIPGAMTGICKHGQDRKHIPFVVEFKCDQDTALR